MTPLPPPIPIPETAERRVAVSCEIQAATGLDEAGLEGLVRTFYANARQDVVIGPLFDRVGDWQDHIARITRFWSSVTLPTGRYHASRSRRIVRSAWRSSISSASLPSLHGPYARPVRRRPPITCRKKPVGPPGAWNWASSWIAASDRPVLGR